MSFEFVTPTPEAPASRLISAGAFRARFTQEELVALESASLDDTSAPMASRQQAAAIRVFLETLRGTAPVDLDSDKAQALLEWKGFLADGRAEAILEAPALPSEAP